MHRIQPILDFWFAPTTKPLWFEPTADFDRTLAVRFGALHRAAAAGAFDRWSASADGCLALCLLLDQVPRNIFRGTPRMFAHDAKALTVARHALDRGFDQRLDPDGRLFLYLPLEHSENLADQEDCVALIEALGNPDTLDYAVRHRDVIARFGRFPHRNQILGRPTTPDEAEFLEQPGSSF